MSNFIYLNSQNNSACLICIKRNISIKWVIINLENFVIHPSLYVCVFVNMCVCVKQTNRLFFCLFVCFTLQYCIGFAIHWHESAVGVHVFPMLNPLPPPSPSHPSGLSQCTSPKHPVSCIEPGLAICFTYDILHVSMPFSQTIPPSPSSIESKRLFNTSMSLLLSHIQGYHYHLSKFHIYALVYCIGVFLSGLLHSV